MWIDLYIDAFQKKYADFSGRSRRTEYWSFILFHYSVVVFLSAVGVSNEEPIIFLILIVYALGAVIPHLAVSVRRLHDVGKSGWLYLVVLIPVVGIIWFLVQMCTDSEPGRNEWGANKKEVNN